MNNHGSSGVFVSFSRSAAANAISSRFARTLSWIHSTAVHRSSTPDMEQIRPIRHAGSGKQNRFSRHLSTPPPSSPRIGSRFTAASVTEMPVKKKFQVIQMILL